MTNPVLASGPALRSLVTADGRLSLSLETVELTDPADDEVIVRVEAAPLNPSDLGLMLTSVRPDQLRDVSARGRRELSGPVATDALARLSARIGQPLGVGLEGMGKVVWAGRGVRHLLGTTVAMQSYGSYAAYRKIGADFCIVLPDGTEPEAGAGAFVNPMTALNIVDTVRREGHKAFIHTAAASNLGQILVRVCQAEDMDLVNIVRSPEQEQLLRDMGSRHVLNSCSASFATDLTDAIRTTGATIAFDAVGGGELASQILEAMERAADQSSGSYSRYGSTVHKQLYVYGGLDPAPMLLRKTFGMAWSVGGWLLFPAMARAGNEAIAAMKERVVRELHTNFASHFSRSVSLRELLTVDVLTEASARSTGNKLLVRPNWN